jgi:hypothetical protein
LAFQESVWEHTQLDVDVDMEVEIETEIQSM